MAYGKMKDNLLMNGNIPKSYFRLTIPNVLSMVITLVYNLADTYFIAAVGNTDLVAGVSLCAPVLTIQMADYADIRIIRHMPMF